MSIPCILVEAIANIAGTETTLYLSTKGYVTGAADTPANTVYNPYIAGGVTLTEEITIDMSATMSYGDIELYNVAGELDAWLGYIWANRSVKVFNGFLGAARSSFTLVFDGVIDDIGSASRDRLNIKIRDKLQRLNCPVSDVKLGGTTANADSVIPLVFGEVCNITPLLINPATLQYQVHNGPIELIIEVRDNGVPIAGFTPNLAAGTFTLSASPAGVITCSVQGDKPSGVYNNTISTIVQRLALGYGKAATQFVSGDLDLTALALFDSLHVQPVGTYLSGRENVINVMQDLAASVGAAVTITRAGKLSLLYIAFPAFTAPVSTNELTNTSTFTGWTFNNLTVSGTPALLTNTVTNAEHRMYYTTGTSTAKTAIIELKANTANFACLSEGNSLGGNYCVFDLVNGVVSSSVGSVNASIIYLGDGWWRCQADMSAGSYGVLFALNIGETAAQAVPTTPYVGTLKSLYARNAYYGLTVAASGLTSLSATDMVESSFHIVSRIPVKSASKIGYCKNWTVQTNLQTGIPVDSKNYLSTEYLTTTKSNATVATNYKLDAEPIERDTDLIASLDAIQEASRDLTIYSTPRTIYGFEGFSQCLSLVLGQSVTLVHPRFGLSAGKTGIVTKLQPDWISFRCQVEVMI